LCKLHKPIHETSSEGGTHTVRTGTKSRHTNQVYKVTNYPRWVWNSETRTQGNPNPNPIRIMW